MNRSLKVVGKLSLWGILLAFLLWLGKQLLVYLLALIMPWIHWLLGWLMLIAGVLVFIVAAFVITVAYIGYRSWRRRRRDGKKEPEKAD